jgi:signal peptidase I
MVPSILPGDLLLGLKGDWVDWHIGHVAVLRCPGAPTSLCVRRVVAQPGDRVEFDQAGKVLVNREGSSQEPVVVPPGHVFVLNDHVEDLQDSRVWGPVSIADLESRVLVVWLSLDWKEMATWPGVRWSRLALRIR